MRYPTFVATLVTVFALGSAVIGLVAPMPAFAAAGCPDTGMPPAMYTSYVVAVQKELALHGYNPGPADGKGGGRTLSAIRNYQRDAGLPVNGCVSKELAEHLMFVLPKIYARGHGAAAATRSDGTVAQSELTRLGYYSGPVDGKIGPTSRKAIRQFQKEAGLAETGQVDNTLLDALRKRQRLR